MKIHSLIPVLATVLLILILAGCAAAVEEAMEAPAAQEPAMATPVETLASEVEKESELPVVEEPAAEGPIEGETSSPQPTATPGTQLTPLAAAPTALPSPAAPLPTALVEPRMVEVEWPMRIFLGDSDVVRMALIPTQNGYTVTTEFPDHQTITQDVPVLRLEGYELYGIGRLNGVGFEIAPQDDQVRSLPLEEAVTWHWSLTPRQPGRQRITLTLLLRWVPTADPENLTREAVAYSKGLEIQVRSFLGLSRGQAMVAGLAGTVFGGGMSLYALANRAPTKTKTAAKTGLKQQKPNRELVIEHSAGLPLTADERSLLQSLFSSYSRVVVQAEFLSGYSGARTLLVLPVRSDGRSDAATIAKIGSIPVILQEYENYQAFVKHTLPPVTARIQNNPVTLPSPRRDDPAHSGRAALQYTFIGNPGRAPVSLRQALLEKPNPALLHRLFETFGPNWWMQRSPYTFRLFEEYDRLLPPHLVIQPEPENGSRQGAATHSLDGRTPWGEISLRAGDRVRLTHFAAILPGADGKSLSIKGDTAPGQLPVRIHWKGTRYANRACGTIVATREDILNSSTTGFERYGWPDPLKAYTQVLEETVIGTRSIIHGDLNLENVLVGPGDFVWLIDFATTREGHPLADFAHLETEIIAHVIAARMPAEVYQATLIGEGIARQPGGKGERNTGNKPVGLSEELQAAVDLRGTVFEIAAKCLSNPSHWREYHLALYLSCLGALKYRNLEHNQKHLLYLTAASLVPSLEPG